MSCCLDFTYADRQRKRRSSTFETSEMRAVCFSLVNRNLIVTEETQKKKKRSRKKETHVKEQKEEEEESREVGGGRDEETGGRAGRSSGRGRTRRQLVSERERSKRNCEEE